GVVELACLPDHDRSGTDDQHGLEVAAARHQASPRSVSGSAASAAPGAAAAPGLSGGRSCPCARSSLREASPIHAPPEGPSSASAAPDPPSAISSQNRSKR